MPNLRMHLPVEIQQLSVQLRNLLILLISLRLQPLAPAAQQNPFVVPVDGVRITKVLLALRCIHQVYPLSIEVSDLQHTVMAYMPWHKPADSPRPATLAMSTSSLDLGGSVTDRRSDPSALRFLIGHDLRLARERSGIKQSDAATVLGCSQSKINYLETGRNQQQPAEAVALMRYYGADEEHVARIASLAGRGDNTTWWEPYSAVLPTWFKTFVGLEGLAGYQFVYKTLQLPGQLQTADYTAALVAASPQVAPTDAQQIVRARMARQRLADESDPLNFAAVLDETAISRPVGGTTIMAAQLDHLLQLSERHNVELFVIPASTAEHVALGGDFTLMDFPEAQAIGYVEYPTGAVYVQDQDQVAVYTMLVDRLRALALPTTASGDVIRSHRDTFGKG